MSERTDGDRVVVTGYSAGSHFPRTQAGMQYKFEADGLSGEGPFVIDGSVYGRDLRFVGPGSVAGPVMGRGDVTLRNHGGGAQRFLGGVHANGNIVSERRAAPLARTLSGDLSAAACVVRGDIIGQHVAIENAVVFGNVRGRRVELSHCIVVGQVMAEEEAVLSASTFLAYAAPRVTFRGPCCALYAMGTSDHAPVFESYTDGAGQSWAPDLRFYPALRGRGSSPLSNRPWEPETPSYAASRLAATDWVRVDAQRTVQRRVDGKNVEQQVTVERYVLSIAGRALNFKTLSEDLERLSFMVRSALEFDHYTPNTQEATRRLWQDRCTPEEVAILRLATDAPARAPAARPRATAAATTAPPTASLPPAKAPASTAAPSSARPAVPSAAPRPPAAAAPASARPAAPTTMKPAASSGAPTASAARVMSEVHLADGTRKKGYVGRLDPRSAFVVMSTEATGGQTEQLALKNVLCVVQHASLHVKASTDGVDMVVEFSNGGKLSGRSYDYAEGRPSLTLHMDHTGSPWAAWIPTSSVRSVLPLPA